MSNTSKWENKLYGINKARTKDFTEKRTKHAYLIYCTILEEVGGSGLMKACTLDITEEE